MVDHCKSSLSKVLPDLILLFKLAILISLCTSMRGFTLLLYTQSITVLISSTQYRYYTGGLLLCELGLVSQVGEDFHLLWTVWE